MNRSTLVLLAPLLVAGGREDPSIEEELDALIAKANALETAHLVYEVASHDDDHPAKGRLDFFYRAPSQGRVRAEFEGEEGVVTECVIVPGMCFARIPDEVGPGPWKRADIPEADASRLCLNELFPDASLDEGVCLGFHASQSTAAAPRFELAFQFTRDRRCALTWLLHLRAHADEVEVEEDALTLLDGDVRLRVARASGVLEEAEVTTTGERALRLLECHLDEGLDESVFALTEEMEAAEVNAGLARQFEAFNDWTYLRASAFARVSRRLDSGELDWDESTREDWCKFLGVLHREGIAKRYGDWIEQVLDDVGESKDKIVESLDRDDSSSARARLAKALANSRENLVASIDGIGQQCRETVPALRTEPRSELLEAETEVLTELWAELVSGPLLEAFDEMVAELDR